MTDVFRPSVNPNGVVSLASYLPTFAPGGLGTIYGRNMASETNSGISASLPMVAGGACVTLNNRPLPLIYTSDGTVNFQVPVDMATGRFPLVVRSIVEIILVFSITLTPRIAFFSILGMFLVALALLYE